MDEAFVPFGKVVEAMLDFRTEFQDDAAGVRTFVIACEFALPVELDMTRDAEGRLVIGSTPPLYGLHTTVSPSFHRMSFTARCGGDHGVE